jgi:hypothetical protein
MAEQRWSQPEVLILGFRLGYAWRCHGCWFDEMNLKVCSLVLGRIQSNRNLDPSR